MGTFPQANEELVSIREKLAVVAGNRCELVAGISVKVAVEWAGVIVKGEWLNEVRGNTPTPPPPPQSLLLVVIVMGW